MKNQILNFLTDDGNGLLIADMPTGYGKTYACLKTIYDYIYIKNGNKKIFFMTTLKKNLPVEDLKKIYKENNNKNFKKDVLVIKSNYDYVFENLLDTEIDNDFKGEEYNKLLKNIKLLKELNDKNIDVMKEYKEVLRKKIREELEPKFRGYINRRLKKEVGGKKEDKIEAIRNDTKFRWIADIYPTVFTDDYKIYLLTIDKFLVKNSVIVSQPYYFITDDITKDAIIFIDEFDAGKKTVEATIIREALSSKNDYIQLFKKIYNAFQSHSFEKKLKEIGNNKNSKYKLDEFKEESKEIFDLYSLNYNYKTVESCIDKKQSFLFNDSSFHTMLRNEKGYIRASKNDEDEKVDIFFENNKEYYQNRSDDDIVIYSLVRTIGSFLNRFRIMILNLSIKYCEYINTTRNSNEDEYTLENSMKTIYREFKLDEKEIKLLMDETKLHMLPDDKQDEKVLDLSFYNNGFKYFELEDGDDHLTETLFNYINIYNTPEKILLYLSKRAKVIGLSATGNIKTVTGNYDLEYLKAELKNNFRKIDDSVYKEIQNELKEEWKPYDNGDIKIHVDIINFNEGHLDIKDRLKSIFGNNNTARRYNRKLEGLLGDYNDDTDYVYKRYCNIFKAIKEFVIHDDIECFLCLNAVLPKPLKNKFDLNIFEDVLKELIKLNGKEKDSICLKVLTSSNFEKSKENVLDLLENGKKVFIMSSYNTIGAGQNMQYKFKNIKDYVVIGKNHSKDDSRIKRKDINAVFLGDITNTAVNVYSDSGLEKEDLIKYFFQNEYLYENDEINYIELDQAIKLGFKKYMNSKETDQIVSKINKTKSIRREVTRDVEQAIGRICRTHVKNKNIYIYLVEEVVEKMDIACIENKILTKEMQALIKEIKLLEYRQSENKKENINRAERISSRAKNHIMKMLSRGWDKENMELWKYLRELVLKYPTASKSIYKKHIEINKLYISSDAKLNRYVYAQKGDFSDVVISFEQDKSVFASSEKCKDRVFISEVSQEEARLSTILKYPGLKEYFEKNNYATTFKKQEYIMPPVLFNNIYKGALGEVAGKFILENEIGIKLNEIKDSDKFEFFDFEIKKGVYIDFKHWKQTYRQIKNRDDYKKEILRKLENISGKRVYIINIVADEEFTIHVQNDERIIEIPALIDKYGNFIKKNIEILVKEILEGELI